MKRVIILLCLACVLLSAGCVGEPGRGVSIAISVGGMNVTEESFRIDGEIAQAGSVGDPDVYRDVMVCLIDETGQILNRTQPMDMKSSPGVMNITVSSNEVPKYVIIHSPDFWDDPDIRVAYYTRPSDSKGFAEHFVQNVDGLPVDTCT